MMDDEVPALRQELADARRELADARDREMALWDRLTVAEASNTGLFAMLLTTVLDRTCASENERDAVMRTFAQRMEEMSIGDLPGETPGRRQEEAMVRVDTIIHLARMVMRRAG